MIIILVKITLMVIIWLTSMRVNLDMTRKKHCLVVKNPCHKHHAIMMVMVTLVVVIIVIMVVKIIMIVPSPESNNKSEFNNCISTETAESFYEVCD